MIWRSFALESQKTETKVITYANQRKIDIIIDSKN